MKNYMENENLRTNKHENNQSGKKKEESEL